MNTIIGGRSTGKSSLIKAIAAKHGSQDVDKDDYIMSHLDGVSIRWQDGNDQVGREIEYFKQSYMHDIAFDTQRTNRLVEGIISHRDTTGLLKSFYENLSDVAKQVTDGVFQLFQLQKEIAILQSKLSESGKSALLPRFRTRC